MSGSWILWSNDTKKEDEISGERVDIVSRGEYYEKNKVESADFRIPGICDGSMPSGRMWREE